MESRRGNVVNALLGGTDASVDEILETVTRAIESGAFPIPGAVRTGELVAACRRSPEVRSAEVRLLKQTQRRLGERIARDQERGRARKDVDPGPLALVLLLVEAGAELLIDLGFPLDARSGTTALRRLMAA